MVWALSGESASGMGVIVLILSRRTTVDETSESETGNHGGPGPSSLRNALAKRKPSVPTVVEP